VVFTALENLTVENESVIRRIRPLHTNFGVVVDMRQAPLRNDPAFENAMQRLRSEVTARFARVVLLLETDVGILQVNRLVREDEQKSFVTRSEPAAIKFAMGQG